MKHKYSKTPPDLKAAPIIIADSDFLWCFAGYGGKYLWHLEGLANYRNTNYPIMFMGTVKNFSIANMIFL